MSDELEKYLDYLKHARGLSSRYHDHKESMAWGATALFLAAVFFFYLNIPGPTFNQIKWLMDEIKLENLNFYDCIALVLSITFCMLVFFFVRWQFIKKRFSVAFDFTCVNLIHRILFNHEELNLKLIKHKKKKLCGHEENTDFWTEAFDCEFTKINANLKLLKSEFITFTAIIIASVAVIMKILTLLACH